jgi:hypothetical protein
MKTLSRKYALLTLLVLALGVGLIAAAPAQASIVYSGAINYTVYNTIIDPENPVIPPGTGWDLTVNGYSYYHIDLFGINTYTYTDGSTTLSINNARAGGMTPLIPGCETYGRNVTEGISGIYTLDVPEMYRLAINTPISATMGTSGFTPTPPLT